MKLLYVDGRFQAQAPFSFPQTSGLLLVVFLLDSSTSEGEALFTCMLSRLVRMIRTVIQLGFHRHMLTLARACVTTYVLFPLTLLILAYLSQPSSSTWLYIISTFFNGFITGAGINYTLAHVLHLTPKHTHIMVTSLIATFRGLAGSFGSAAGGGIFLRLLRSSLKRGFEVDGGLGKAEQEVIRQLLGSPALVWQMTGAKKSIAVKGYVDAIQGVFLAGSMLAVAVIMIQAGTGWQTLDRVPVAEDAGIEPSID